MYICGITPYDVTHLGHAATYIWADAAERVLRWQGHAVTVARNVTDVDEVLFAEAHRRGEPPTMMAALQRASFEASMSKLRVRRPDHDPTATQSVGNVIQLAAALLVKDAAYLRNGTVYARTARAAEVAGLSRPAALERAAEYRDDPDDPDKDDPLDVAVWQATAGRPNEDISWPSPWGAGRPGWHAECAAMVLALFGGGVDLHCGGADLEFPHHACESVLAEAATGVAPFARAWLRAGTVCNDGVKMAKSTQNLVLVDDVLRDHSVAAVRLLCLNRPWAQSWSYASGELDAMAGLLEELYSAAGKPGGRSAAAATELLNDLDVPRAIAVALEDGGAAARTLVEVLGLS
jgi:cysteinyl-tRNA synthetase